MRLKTRSGMAILMRFALPDIWPNHTIHYPITILLNGIQSPE
ncbi:hypothetical protein LDG_6414 [Legionella drancourtii LLAP12]|uniref:Uncharacterized protein n=1 Tax=Legionella drancourtii LLAP12 TaxID=658187 RepID=G9EME8_9GAMM|nr:hypothetical protein LDG_6414 [Legionella drancourtii LLAP12]